MRGRAINTGWGRPSKWPSVITICICIRILWSLFLRPGLVHPSASRDRASAGETENRDYGYGYGYGCMQEKRAYSQPFSRYHSAVFFKPSRNPTDGSQPRSVRVLVLSHTHEWRMTFTFSRVSITALPRTLP